MSMVLRGRRSKVSPRMPPTVSLRRCSGLLVLGLPGLVAYKAINTADSMIGHRTPRHEAFGWAAARLDDIVNLPASRLTGLLFAAAALVTSRASAREALRAMRRDAPKHRSPNAGWPESAMAGALGLKLNGPKNYDGALVEDAYMGDGRREATAQDIRKALRLAADGLGDHGGGAARDRRHFANVSRRSTSTCRARCSASASSVASTSCS